MLFGITTLPTAEFRSNAHTNRLVVSSFGFGAFSCVVAAHLDLLDALFIA
jgi:hypothetical protein